MLSPGEAARTILAGVSRLPVESIPLRQAIGRVLATDVESPIDLPGWDNSAMDGFAVRSRDMAGVGGITLRIVETIPAGAFPTKRIGPGECSRIFTGAPLPEGADSVIRQEDCTASGDDRVVIDDVRDAGRNVRKRGEDIRLGAPVLSAGTPLGPAQLGVLASIAHADVKVYRRPRVAYMGSGDEIADLDERDAILAGRKIASSNSYTLHALIECAGATPLDLGIARDDPADIRKRLADGADADLCVTTAGISVGEHDHMRTVLDQLGGALAFWRIRMRPGAPVGFGRIGATPWIGLPGNPVSTMVTFELFVLSAIRKMLGYTTYFRRSVRVRMGERVVVKAPLTHFLRVALASERGERVARLTGPQGSGILTSMAAADALLIVPAETEELAVGTDATAIVLDDPVFVGEPPFA